MPRISIEFDTNAKSVAKQVKDLENVLGDIEKRGRGRRRAASGQTRSAVGDVAQQINRADLTRPGSQNVIRAANQAGLGTQLESTANMAGAMLGGVLGKELQQGIGYIVNENLRPIKQAIARLREKAASTPDPAIAGGITQLADDLQTQLSAYQEIAVSRKAALQALQEPKTLQNLEKVRSQYSKLGVDVGSVGDLGKFASQLATVSPGVSAAISTLTANVDNIDPQEYAKQVQKIAVEGLKQVQSQRDELKAAIQRQTQKANRRVGTAFTKVFEEKFGSVNDFITGAATFDRSSFTNQAALSVFREQIKSTAPRDILSNLDARSIPQLQALSDARGTGDPARIATALSTAEKAIQRRIKAVQEDLTKLGKIAEATGDADLKAAINQLRTTAKEAQQKLLNQVTSSQRAIQSGMFASMDAALGQFKQVTATAKGSKVANFTKQWLIDYNNSLTDSIGTLLQNANKTFAGINFQSLGGQSLAQMFPGKKGGLGAQANVLTQSLLAPAGFFSATTAEGRMDAIAEASKQVVPVLKKIGLSGKELDDAAEQLGSILEAVSNAYKPVLASVQKLNAEQFYAARARANRAIAEGRFADARAELDNLTPYATTAVPTSRRQMFTSEDQVSVTAPNQIPEFSRTNYEENRDRIEADILRGEDRANRGGIFERLGRFAGRALSIFGGLQFAIGGTAAAIGGLVEQANRLDRAAATVNALSGSFQGFNQVLALATMQQAKFGGTLEENLQGFNSLIPVAKRYGADLLQLDNIARRLAVIDPVQGFQGASIALKEFFSGDITSLSRRFEIDRKTLNSIKDAGSQLEQLQELDKVLAELGISNAVLEARTQTTAATYDKFGATLSNTTTLLGKYLQSGFANLVENVTDTINYTGQLSDVLANEQAYINLTTNIERVARKLVDLQTATEAVENPLAKYVGDFVNLDALVDRNTKSVDELVAEWNSLIVELNRLRALEGQPLLRLFSTEDYQVIEDLVTISNATGIPVLSLLEDRDPLTGQPISAGASAVTANNQVTFLEDLLANFTGYETEAVRNRNRTANLYGMAGGGGLLAPIRNMFGSMALPDQYFAGMVQEAQPQQAGYQAFSGVVQMQQNLRQVMPSYLEQLQRQTETINANTGFYERQAQILEEQTGINYTEQLAEYANQLEFGQLTQEESNEVVRKMLELNKQLLEVTEARIKYESDYITQNLASASSFGGQALNESLLNQMNQITQENATQAQKILAQAYLGAGGGASATGMSTELMHIVEMAQTMYGVTREQLYYLSQVEKRQARVTLEANKSVSAYGALRGQLTGMQIPMSAAVRLAMEFNDSVQGMVSGTMLGQLGSDDRMRFLQGEFSNPMSMQSQGDVLGNLDSVLSAILEKEQERLDLAAKEANLAQERAEEARKKDEERLEFEEKRTDLMKDNQKDLLELAKDYEEKKVDLLKDYEDKKTNLVEDFEKRKLQAIKDAQLQVKENRTDFFSALFGAEALTQEDRNRFTGEYEKIVQEAASLRDAGSFQAAENVLSSGLQLLVNQINLLDQLKSSQDKLADTNKELLELTKTTESGVFGTGLSKEKDKLDKESKDLQEEIARLEQRIKDLQVLQKLQYDEDATRLDQARKLRDQEKKEFKEAMDEMGKTYKDKLKEMDDDYKKSLADREANFKESLDNLDEDFAKSTENQKVTTIEAEKAQILSFDDMMKFRQAGYLALEAARLAAEGGNREDIQGQLSSGLASIREYFTQRGTPASQAILTALDTLENLSPGINQRFNPAIGEAIGAGSGQNNPYLEEMRRAGVDVEGITTPSAIAPFQAALLNNAGKIETNTEALAKATDATDKLRKVLETRSSSNSVSRAN
jgi:hypothetical protein